MKNELKDIKMPPGFKESIPKMKALADLPDEAKKEKEDIELFFFKEALANDITRRMLVSIAFTLLTSDSGLVIQKKLVNDGEDKGIFITEFKAEHTEKLDAAVADYLKERADELNMRQQKE